MFLAIIPRDFPQSIRNRKESNIVPVVFFPIKHMPIGEEIRGVSKTVDDKTPNSGIETSLVMNYWRILQRNVIIVI